MSTENMVVRAGWFGAKVYSGTPTFKGSETFVRLPIAGSRPKYCVAKQAAIYDASSGAPTKPIHCVVIPCANVGTATAPEYVGKLYLFDGTTPITAADPTLKYEVLLME